MTYVKAIQSYDTQIENLEIKSEKTLAFLVVSLVMIFPVAIAYHATNLNPYEALLIPLGLKLFLIITGYALLFLTICQGILEICREFVFDKELFIRVTRRYSIKKGVSSLFKICAGRRANKSRSITPNNPNYSTKVVLKNVINEDPDSFNGFLKSNWDKEEHSYKKMWRYGNKHNYGEKWQNFVKESENNSDSGAARKILKIFKEVFPDEKEYPAPTTIKDHYSPNRKQ